MIEKLQLLNDNFIATLQNNPQELKKHQLIKDILNNKDCFLNMEIEVAYSILRDLQIPETELKKIYLELINPQ